MNYQGLTLAECWRFGGNLLGFAFAIVFKLRAKPGNHVWLPPQEAEQACTREELSPAAQQRLDPLVAQLADLGYRAGHFKRMVKCLDRTILDSGAYLALHGDGQRFLLLGYVHSRVAKDAVVVEADKVNISAGVLRTDRGSLSVVNHRNYMDSQSCARHIRLEGAGLPRVADRLERELRQYPAPLMRFRSLEHLAETLCQVGETVWSQYIERRLFVKVSIEEERRVLQQFGWA